MAEAEASDSWDTTSEKLYSMLWQLTLYHHALEQIASRGCTVVGEGCGHCPSCLAAQALREDSEGWDPDSSGSGECLIGPNEFVRGEYHTDRSLHISGRVEGLIVCEGEVYIDEFAEVKADVVAEQVRIEGKYSGLIECGGTVTVKPLATVTGEIRTRRLVIQEGAYCAGTVRMGEGVDIGEFLEERQAAGVESHAGNGWLPIEEDVSSLVM